MMNSGYATLSILHHPHILAGSGGLRGEAATPSHLCHLRNRTLPTVPLYVGYDITWPFSICTAIRCARSACGHELMCSVTTELRIAD